MGGEFLLSENKLGQWQGEKTNVSQIEFVKDKDTKEPFAISDKIAMGIHEKGESTVEGVHAFVIDLANSETGMQEPFNISIYPGTGTVDGRRGDHVLIAPAYNVTEDDVRTIVDKVAQVISQFFADREQS